MGDEFKTREIWVAKSRSSWGRSDGQSEYPLPNLIIFHQQQGSHSILILKIKHLQIKQHDPTAPISQSMRHAAQSNTGGGDAMDKEYLGSILRTPFICPN